MKKLENVASQNAPAAVGLSRPSWWGVFFLATVGLSLFFGSFKEFTLEPGWTSGLQTLGAFLLVLAAMGVLVYDGYAKDRIRQRVVRPFKLFEGLFARQYGRETDLTTGGPRP